MMAGIRILATERPDHRLEAAAMSLMDDAFDPLYGEAWTAAQLGGFICLPGVRLSVAQLEGAWLGFALTRIVADEAELLLLGVGRQWRGLGIGQALLSDSMAHARRAGADMMHLEVRQNNDAVRLYAKLGFEQVNLRPNYYRGVDGTTYHALSYNIDL